ncbi:hypothetical protein KM043_018872 [Ampulex compressa]|nr:hypothetical protein KM043_018872 [Ampulex compressa]
MDGDGVKFEKLTDSNNWMQWKFQIRAILDARNALELIDGIFVQPKGNDTENLQTQFICFKYNFLNIVTILAMILQLTAWNSTLAAEPTLEKLVLRLIVEETQMGINDISMNAESALMVKKHFKKRNAGSNVGQRIQKRDKAESSKDKLKCWNCGGPHQRRKSQEMKKIMVMVVKCQQKILDK